MHRADADVGRLEQQNGVKHKREWRRRWSMKLGEKQAKWKGMFLVVLPPKWRNRAKKENKIKRVDRSYYLKNEGAMQRAQNKLKKGDRLYSFKKRVRVYKRKQK